MLRYTDKMAKFLEAGYKQKSLSELTKAFNKKFGTDKKKATLRSFMSRRGFFYGRSSLFTKGRKPWNSGTKGLGYTSANKTSFKKGHVPSTRKHIGAERVQRGGYIEVKVKQKCKNTGRATCYRFKHIVEYEKAHGKVPEGYVLRFKDSDKSNCTLDNLQLVTRRVHLYLNKYGYSSLPMELKTTLLAIAKLDIKAAELREK